MYFKGKNYQCQQKKKKKKTKDQIVIKKSLRDC